MTKIDREQYYKEAVKEKERFEAEVARNKGSLPSECPIEQSAAGEKPKYSLTDIEGFSRPNIVVDLEGEE